MPDRPAAAGPDEPRGPMGVVPTGPRKAMLQLRLYPEELEVFRRCADARGQTIAGWARYVLRHWVEFEYDEEGWGLPEFLPQATPDGKR